MAPVLGRRIKRHGQFEFEVALSPSVVLKAEKEIWIMDVVKGLKAVTLITNPKALVLENTITCHDLDLGFYLKLLEATGKISTVKIIGLPFGHRSLEKLEKAVLEILDQA